MIPTIKAELKPEQLPSWDGNHDTAVEYFWKVQQLASLGGHIPQALGYWLWSKLVEGSTAQTWFATLTFSEQARMRSHYILYLKGIKDNFLGKIWQRKMNSVYELQSFRQAGFERETPPAFITRRVMYTRMLVNSDNGGPLEVWQVMQKAPIAWGPIIVVDNIVKTSTLFAKVTEHELALVHAARLQASNLITADNLDSMLKKLGYMNQGSAANRGNYSRRANLIENIAQEVDPVDLENSNEFGIHAFNSELAPASTDDGVLKEAYQVIQRRQRPPPEGGYPFTKNDHVTMKMGRLPPSLCKVCGSKNHWDKECSDWAVYLERQRKHVKLVTTSEEDQVETMYHSAYSVLMNQRLVNIESISGFEAASSTAVEAPGRSSNKLKRNKTANEKDLLPKGEQIISTDECIRLNGHELLDTRNSSSMVSSPSNRRTTMEIVEDEYWDNQGRMPTATKHLLESDDDMEEELPSRTVAYADHREASEVEQMRLAGEGEERDEIPKICNPPPPYEQPVRLTKWRAFAPGKSSVGMSVLSMPGWVGGIDNRLADLRVDSCADITLISAEFLAGLVTKPKILQGEKMKLWQLTKKGTSLLGYVRIPIFLWTNEGTMIEAEAEAYVVPDMTVPILLGEDFQQTYELGVTRSVDNGTEIRFGRTNFSVRAERVGRTNDFGYLRKSVAMANKFTKAKTHQRDRRKRQRRREKMGEGLRIIRAAEDYRIRAHECKNISVEGNFSSDQEWLVEKNLISNKNDTFLVVPNVLISSRRPIVPISNPSDHPRSIRKGEIIGSITDPSSFLDRPRNQEHLAEMQKAADALAAIIKVNITATGGDASESRAEDPTAPTQEGDSENARPGESVTTPVRGDEGSQTELGFEEDEDYGPKTAAMPDPTIYPSAKIRELIDVGSLPEHLQEAAWEMLERRKGAFGFDGRLGHHPSKVHIRTVDGQVPIAVPMYASSPAKRAVMDEQLDKWFELGVIEPSKSPWSAPVVIAYRNGKPRFCVDYRKLNAVTIGDEFPIPRQLEILQSLSGAQVLSSLDALAGFTQLEFEEDQIEKTAFRTHRGLFQFRRMPFGLKNGPSIFQRVMQGILAPYLWIFCLVYIDDIVVYSRTYEDHIKHLDQVLEAIERAGITLSPNKCHLFYDSILLLGHKVSRLGLSTHEEKVKAILELEHPRKLSLLQTFLGMVVYFSAFIPYYASICTPLFQLLKKGTPWRWGAEEEHAFKSAKEALRKAPLLGHPIEGLPYRLYTDASDEAAGCALQQIQPIKVKDLEGTRAYERLKKAFDEGIPPPKLTASIGGKSDIETVQDKWGESLDETTVYVERVIAYWSQTFKGAEQRYSTTEREALAAKEGLVKFQPFIEGEKITLVTDHSALQWARTYENSNRWLAAWGAIFSAYAPGLEIVHRAGRVHSNVDPLSRLPRAPPAHVSPIRIDGPSILTDNDLADAHEKMAEDLPAKRATFVAWDIEDCLEDLKSAWVSGTEQGGTDREKVASDYDKLEAIEVAEEYWGTMNKPPNIHITMEQEFREEFIADYQTDPGFASLWNSEDSARNKWVPGRRFFKNEEGLLLFSDADYQPRLCVPERQREFILEETHENPLETAHAGPEKLWQRLSQKFYWSWMKKDILEFCNSCDVCQKTKPSNFNRYGYLIPNPIPSRPYESVSMDFIVNLPWSGEFNAIYVVVDRLSKHANFIPTTTGVNAEEFGYMFVKNIVSKFGLSESIVTDRDPRWTSDFWKAVASHLKTKMALSSSHHPQHDGQTEVVNKTLETMLRAYTAENKESWAEWIHLLEFAYNSNVHSSTGCSPYFLLYGFNPTTPVDFIAGRTAPGAVGYGLKDSASNFLTKMEMHRGSTRRAIAKAQDEQARYYNRGRRSVPEFKKGDRVLLNPHSLEWLESKGLGKKLTQRWIGPFEVIQKINPKVYRLRMSSKYPGSPVFNIDHLKKYVPSPPKFSERTLLPETRDHRPEEEEFDVEDIIGHKWVKAGRRREIRYLVRWEGYGPQYDTWEPTINVKNAGELLAGYKRRNRL